ncbi:MAG: SDR family NAD(P)-dependent oxidoreductase, partial [Ignavibacteria bacterium]|nr:SDR family NAD(P)-dependent oxidoreductase [Ignavibacteria bacterium]
IVQEIQKNYLDDFDSEEAVKAIRKAVSEEHNLQVYSVTLIKPGTVPKTSSGKIQRKACKSGVEDGSLEIVVQWRNNELTDYRQTGVKTQTDKNSITGKEQVKKEFILNKSNLKEWLTVRLSELMQIKKETIDTSEPFAVYGIDSLKAVQLSGDLETLLGKELPAAIVYDYPNINSLADYLAGDTKAETANVKSSVSSGKQNAGNEPVAIVGIGLKFPDAKNVNEFWINLKNGRDSIRQIPENRWDKNSLNPSTVTFGGFVDDTDKFDPVFFGISPREAVQIDPQQRFTLETAWQALEDAGINPNDLAGTNAGVFIGICTYDYARYSAGRKEYFDVYTGTGTSLSIAANRLSYFFDFRGPSIAIDTACSSSLVALHTACESLRNGQSSVALAGGVNLLLAPDWNIVFTEADMLAPDGRCKTFDKDADGYVRSEGCGIVVLKKLSDAERDGDRIYAVIRGSAINQDGRSNGLTAPNGPSQVAVIKKAVDNAGINADEISYVETHGTGTPLGDPIEVNSIKEALSTGREKDKTLLIGSVKTNIGHLEAAAGIAGVIKTSLALFNQEIPAHLNFKNLNPEILIEGTPVKVADKNKEWKGEKRFAGVSSFGFGGTNAHVILQSAPSVKTTAVKSKPHNILTLSAKNENSLNESADNYEKFLNENKSLNTDDICFSANKRAGHNHRLAIICSDTEDLKKEIANYKKRRESPDVIHGTVRLNHFPKIAFLFPGQGAQYIGMGKELYDTHPLFRKTINRCDEILRNHLEKSLLEVLFYEKDENLNPINETMYTQPALFSVEYALAQLWMSWGVRPSVMMGHSAGEYIAACLAGVFSLEDGLMLVTERGRLMETLTSNGEMYTIFTDEKKAREAIKDYADTVSVASINSPFKTVISGNKDSLAKILPGFDSAMIEYKKINVSIASHSPLMKTMIEEFRKVCNSVKYSAPAIPVVSNITGEIVTDRISGADYWCEHIMSGVRFSDSIKACVNYGCDTFIDLGPKPTSIGMGQESVMDPKITWLASFKKNFTAWETMLQGLGRLYVNGLNPDWNNFDKDFSHKLISLPSYPFQKQRYWIDESKGSRSKSFSPLFASEAGSINSLTGSLINTASENEFIFNSVISGDSPAFLNGHIVFGKTVFPGAGFIETALSAYSSVMKIDKISISDIIFHQILLLENDEPSNVQTVLSRSGKDSFTFRIYSQSNIDGNVWTLHASGKLSGNKHKHDENGGIDKFKKEFSNEINVNDFYRRIDKTGVEYKKEFRGVKKLYANDKSVFAFIGVDTLNLDKFLIHPALLDSAFQSVLSILVKENGNYAFIPTDIEEFRIFGRCTDRIYCNVKLHSQKIKSEKGYHKADLDIYSEEGNLIAKLKSLRLREVKREELIPAADEINDWFYGIKWIKNNQVVKETVSLFMPAATEIVKSCSKYFSRSLKENGSDRYVRGIRKLNSLCINYMLRALTDAGVKSGAGNIFRPDDFKVIPSQKNLFSRILKILEENGYLKSADGRYETTELFTVNEIITDSEKLKKDFPEISAEFNLLSNCAGKLHEVLSGRTEPLQLLFPDGDLSQTTSLYKDSPAFSAMNNAVKTAVEKIVSSLPDGRVLRILELGAGTGSTTSFLLPVLPAEKTKYIFTDISSSFFNKAKEKFNQYGFIEFKTLDLEKDAIVQGFEKNSFDLIIASNVIHATKDLKTSAENILKLLSGKGILILNEVTEKNNWIDLTFGMTEGWWRFSDRDLRPDYALLSGDSWKRFLKETGFETAVVSAPEPEDNSSFTSQSLIIAEAPERNFAAKSNNHILFFSDNKSAVNISSYLKNSDLSFSLITDKTDKHKAKSSGTILEADFSDKSDLAELIIGIQESVQDRKKLSVVYINSHNSGIKTGDIKNETESCCIKLVNILKAISESGLKNNPSLYIVTHDSQYVIKGDNLNGLVFSPLNGLAKVIRMEHPEYKCKSIDFDSKYDIKYLIEEINPDSLSPEFSGEEIIAFRDGDRYTARLEKIKTKFNDDSIRIHKDSSYLITGGLSGIGLLTAKFLSDKGAKHLILSGRRDKTDESDELLNQIKSAGTEVRIIKADITNKGDVENIFSEIKKSGTPLKGIIHSAGILDDGVIMNQTKEKFSRVMSPKVLGAWYLHENSKKLKLDFFIMYSSVASLLGSAGQSNHSSANAFLDGLAYYRKSKGLAAMSINWGVWSEIGSAAAKGADKQEKIPGLKTINPSQGIRALERAMNTGNTQTGILPVDWKKFNERYKSRFTEGLTDKYSDTAFTFKSENTDTDFITSLENAGPEDQTEILKEYFRKVISGIMGLEPDELDAEQPLNTIGLDSLMAIELKNKVNSELGVDLNLVRYMEETNISQLAEELKEQLPALLNKKDDLLTGLKKAPQENKFDLLIKYFQNLISRIMGLSPDDLDIEQPLNSVGLDSLMAIELKNKVNIELGVDLNLVRYMEETNIIKLAEELKEQLPDYSGETDSEAEEIKTVISDEDKTRDLLANIDNLSEEELERLLKEMN